MVGRKPGSAQGETHDYPQIAARPPTYGGAEAVSWAGLELGATEM